MLQYLALYVFSLRFIVMLFSSQTSYLCYFAHYKLVRQQKIQFMLTDTKSYKRFKDFVTFCKTCYEQIKQIGNIREYLFTVIKNEIEPVLSNDTKDTVLNQLRNLIYSTEQLNNKFFNKELLPTILKQLDMTNSETRKAFQNLSAKLFKIGFCLNTYTGSSLGLTDFVVGKTDTNRIPTSTKARQMDVVDVEKIYSEVLDETLANLKENKSMLYYITHSGARANWSQIKQMLVGRGYVDAGDGRVLYISGNYLDGLDIPDMLLTGIGAVKAVYDKSVNTYRPGYLTRQLMYCAVSELISDDCGSTEYFELHVTNKKLAESLIGKYYLDEESNTLKKIEPNMVDDIIGKKLKLRSVLYCNHKWHICKTCFGDTYVTRHYTRIASIMAQILGERATQLSMRAFHTGGSVSFSVDAASLVANYPDYLAVKDKTVYTKKPCQIDIPETYLTTTGIVLMNTTLTLKYEDGTEINIPLVKGDILHARKTKKLSANTPIADLGVQHISTQIAILESVLQRKDIVTNPELFTHLLYSLFSDVATYDFGYFELLTAHLLFHNGKPMIAYTGSEVKKIKEWTKMPLKLIPHMLSWKRGFGYERLKLALDKMLLNPESDMSEGFLEQVTFSNWPIDPFDIADSAKDPYKL